MDNPSQENSVPPSPCQHAKRRNIKITVATVTWNAGKLIERTINSVEKQTYAYVEHLIIDGNSHDETLEHVHHYQERNSRSSIKHEIVCISEPDEGLYDAMNKAIDMATGSYIIFLNAGDTFHNESTLQNIVKVAKSVDELPAVIYGDTNLVDQAERFIRKRRLSPPEHLSWRSFKEGMLVCHQAFFARTDIVRKIHYDRQYRFSADFDWCIRIMRKADEMGLAIVNAHIVVANYLSEGLTTRNHNASLCERFRIMRHHYGLLPTIRQHVWFIIRSFIKK